MSLGPVMLDLNGTMMDAEEREILRHPLVGGIILFSRNFEDPEQLTALVKEVHELRQPRLLIAVDHEGGRVQRFRKGFTHLPPARVFGRVYDDERRRAKRLAEDAGWVMARELRAAGVDFSFAPVLDLDRGISEVIGDRAFHSDPQAVSELAGAFCLGMRRAGMAATGKHFPGHGAVAADSHVAVPVDERRFEDLSDDIAPFERLIENGLAGIMPAHVIYERTDRRPAGFSDFWLKEVLRARLGFQGVIFSDDLSMEGASTAGSYPERAEAAFAAGCDMVLVCNNRAGAVLVLDGLPAKPDPVLDARLARMHGQHPTSFKELHMNTRWRQTVAALDEIGEDPTLMLEL